MRSMLMVVASVGALAGCISPGSGTVGSSDAAIETQADGTGGGDATTRDGVDRDAVAVGDVRHDGAALETCEDIERAYQMTIGAVRCQVPTDCQVLDGQCGVGLGGCYEITNASVAQQRLDELGQLYAQKGCTAGVCDCAGPPLATCRDGQCVAQP